MTVADVKTRVRAIKKMAHDDESAHSSEDQLREDVLRAIADGTATDSKQLAREALKTSDIKFARWCA